MASPFGLFHAGFRLASEGSLASVLGFAADFGTALASSAPDTDGFSAVGVFSAAQESLESRFDSNSPADAVLTLLRLSGFASVLGFAADFGTALASSAPDTDGFSAVGVFSAAPESLESGFDSSSPADAVLTLLRLSGFASVLGFAADFGTALASSAPDTDGFSAVGVLSAAPESLESGFDSNSPADAVLTLLRLSGFASVLGFAADFGTALASSAPDTDGFSAVGVLSAAPESLESGFDSNSPADAVLTLLRLSGFASVLGFAADFGTALASSAPGTDGFSAVGVLSAAPESLESGFDSNSPADAVLTLLPLSGFASVLGFVADFGTALASSAPDTDGFSAVGVLSATPESLESGFDSNSPADAVLALLRLSGFASVLGFAADFGTALASSAPDTDGFSAVGVFSAAPESLESGFDSSSPADAVLTLLRLSGFASVLGFAADFGTALASSAPDTDGFSAVGVLSAAPESLESGFDSNSPADAVLTLLRLSGFASVLGFAADFGTALASSAPDTDGFSAVGVPSGAG